MPKRAKLPRDMNQLGKAIVDVATGNAPPVKAPHAGKDQSAVALGRKGGLARAKGMSKKKRSAAAKKAAAVRWGQK